jgi:alpha-1,3-glucosyltransferase
MRNPTNRNFILSLFSVSLAFYLFSFHVHEKQILCPTLILGLAFPDVASAFTPFILTATFNLLELIQREKNELTFGVLEGFGLIFLGIMQVYALNNFRLSFSKSKCKRYCVNFFSDPP